MNPWRKRREVHAHWRRWHGHWRHSLGKRLITLFVVLALAIAAVFIGGVQRGLSQGWRQAAKPLLADYMDRLVLEIGAPPSIDKARALTEKLPIWIRIEGPQVNWVSHPGKQIEPRLGGEGGWLWRPTADGHRVSFGINLRDWQHGPGLAGWLTLALLLLLILGAFTYVRRLLSPLREIGAGAERFGRGDFATPIPLRRRDELGELADRINTMAHDIQGMLDAKRALLLAMSHELRSPLTRARVNAELLPETGEGSAERAALLRDLGEMRDLITGLLESERLASPHSALQREPVDLAALVRDVAAEHLDAEPSGEVKVARVALDLSCDLPPLSLDRMRVRLLVRNLLDNALRHGAGADESPRVTLRPADGGGVLLQVRDFGPGVEPAQLAHLTEPFYRTDSARARATGGVGLGLYLCRLIAQAHGGNLSVSNAQPGLQFDVLLNQ